jgi:hypothetical protein
MQHPAKKGPGIGGNAGASDLVGGDASSRSL